MPDNYYRRNLPHIHPPNAVFFFTYNLQGAVPKHVIDGWKTELEIVREGMIRSGLSPAEVEREYQQLKQRQFVRYEKYLDRMDSGPRFLKQHAAAKVVIDSIAFLARAGDWKPICYSIMPNHVHLMAHRIQHVQDTLKRHKSFTAKQLNQIVPERTGGQVWQRETFDHYLRNRSQCAQKVLYVLLNPVKAGLCNRWWEHPFTWLSEEYMHLIPMEERP